MLLWVAALKNLQLPQQVSCRPCQGQANEDNMIMGMYSKAVCCKNYINTGLGILSPEKQLQWHKGSCMEGSLFNSANSWILLGKIYLSDFVKTFLFHKNRLRILGMEYQSTWIEIGGYVRENNLWHNNFTDIKPLALNLKEKFLHFSSLKLPVLDDGGCGLEFQSSDELRV